MTRKVNLQEIFDEMGDMAPLRGGEFDSRIVDVCMVATVFAHFKDSQFQGMRDAKSIAGMNVLRIIS